MVDLKKTADELQMSPDALAAMIKGVVAQPLVQWILSAVVEVVDERRPRTALEIRRMSEL